MSQLNNENEEINTNKLINEIEKLENAPKEENKQEKVKKKFWTTKKVIIFLIIFTIISVGITAGLIYIENNNKPNNVEIIEEKKEIEPDNLGVKSFKDTYVINELEIIDHSYTEGEKIEIKYSEDYTEEYYPIQVNYAQISGLKDKDIQNRINEEIENTAINWISRRR
ncbi:MAG: hypothetical protein ACI4UE_00830 [Candidatus Scatovivens sp.]